MSKVQLVAFLLIMCAGLSGCLGDRRGQTQKTDTAMTQPSWAPEAPAVATQPASPATATTPWRRVLLHEDFEAGKGPWSGKIITDNVSAGSTQALGAVPTETHWARRAAVNSGRTLQATQEMVFAFRYYISKDIPITIYIFDSTQKDNLRYDIRKPVVGKWTDVAVSINRDFRRNDGSTGKVQPGDALKGISFLSGKTGVDEFDLAVDDVEVTGME